ncbi:MAG TPA: hypothetical protein VJH21_02700 [Candidatus Paceibacterota bacterium]
MGPEARDLLEENLRLTKENNRLLRKLKRAQTISTIFKIIWIAVLIGVPLVLYVYVIEPYYQEVQTRYDELQQRVEAIPGLGAILEQLKHQQSGN